jgi:hypothetical protein
MTLYWLISFDATHSLRCNVIEYSVSVLQVLERRFTTVQLASLLHGILYRGSVLLLFVWSLPRPFRQPCVLSLWFSHGILYLPLFLVHHNKLRYQTLFSGRVFECWDIKTEQSFYIHLGLLTKSGERRFRYILCFTMHQQWSRVGECRYSSMNS